MHVDVVADHHDNLDTEKANNNICASPYVNNAAAATTNATQTSTNKLARTQQVTTTANYTKSKTLYHAAAMLYD